jgi:hypothetical protein
VNPAFDRSRGWMPERRRPEPSCQGIVGRRLNVERLSFVQTFVFPTSHMELLAVREAKKEQAAHDMQLKEEAVSEADEDEELSATP